MMRKSKTEHRFGLFSDIPEDFKVQKKQRKKYIVMQGKKKIGVVAFSKNQIAEAYRIPETRMKHEIFSVDALEKVDCNLCSRKSKS